MIALLERHGGEPNPPWRLHGRSDLARKALEKRSDTLLPDDGCGRGPVSEQLIAASARWRSVLYDSSEESWLEQVAKLPLGQPCVANDASPRVGIYRIVPGNGHDSHSVCHHDVPALPGYAETGLLQSFHRPEMRNTCDPAHRLRRDFDFAEFVFARELPGNRKIILNSISDAGESLFFGLSLRPAAWQTGARNAIALFCLG